MSVAQLENPGVPLRGFLFGHTRLTVGDREARADRQGRELVDRRAAGTLLLVEPRGHMRVPLARYGRITVPGSSRLQSMRIVQWKRRPTSKVDR